MRKLLTVATNSVSAVASCIESTFGHYALVKHETILADVIWSYQDARNRSASQQTPVCQYSFDYGNWGPFSGESTGYRMSGSVAFVLHGAWIRSFYPQGAARHHRVLVNATGKWRLLTDGSLSGSPDYPVLPDCPK